MADKIIIAGRNFSNMQGKDIDFADEYIECNFAQTKPGKDASGRPKLVTLWPMDPHTQRRFVRCNLTNVRIPEGSIVEECNTYIQDYQEEVIEGEEIIRRQVFHGKTNPKTLIAEFLDQPEQIEDRREIDRRPMGDSGQAVS